MICDDGNNMYSIKSDIKKDKLKIITEEKLLNISLTNKEEKDMIFCNLGINDLLGKLYDNNGNIYYLVGDEIYKFKLKIKYFIKN